MHCVRRLMEGHQPPKLAKCQFESDRTHNPKKLRISRLTGQLLMRYEETWLSGPQLQVL